MGTSAREVVGERAARRRYDHRIRNAVVDGRSLTLAATIPESTRRSWQRRGRAEVVTLEPAEQDVDALLVRVASLERQVERLAAVVRVLVLLVKITGATLAERRVPGGVEKRRVLREVERSEIVLGRDVVLRLLGLSEGRLREWRHRALECRLEDAPSCPRVFPLRLTSNERHEMRSLVEDPRYRHLPIRSLAIFAARAGRVFAHARTWYALVRRHGWRRPRARLYPAKPKVGLRASAPNEWWHVDVTIVRLLDGTRAYVHGVIDNYSRKMVAWAVEPELRAATTRALLLSAREGLASAAKVRVMTDGGSENLIVGTDAGLAAIAEHVVAQVGVAFSNSMIEAFWRSLRHQWLYLHSLDSIDVLRRLVAEYVDDHNALIPRVELGGRTPDEAYAGREGDLHERLSRAHREARRARVEVNRSASCGACVTRSPDERSAP